MKRNLSCILFLGLLFFCLSCGKKGPLEPPIIRVPKDIELLEFTQRGSRIFLRWQNPTHYIDGNPVREISKVEIWILEKDRESDSSVEPVTKKDFKKGGKLLISIPQESFADYWIEEGVENPVFQFAHPLDQDFLSKEYYFSFRVMDVRKRNSDYSDPFPLSPVVLPLPPQNVRAAVFEEKIVIHWEPPERNIDLSVPPSIRGYSLFRSEEGKTVRLNSSLIDGLEFEDNDFDFAATYLYLVRAVASNAPPGLESEDSEGFAVTPKDIFPPAPPQGLVVVAGADLFSLSWNANRERDFQGYRVWRKAEGSANFSLLTQDPIPENSYTDTTVEKNQRYHYAITALDNMDNESRKSATVSEILRRGFL